MPELQLLRADHASAVLAFETENRAYFASFISDRGDDYFDHFVELHDLRLAEQEAGEGAYYVLVDDDGSVLGRFNLIIEDDVADVGYRVAERAAGRGVATRAVQQLCWLASEQHGLRTLKAATSLDNRASQRVLLKAGFVEVGPADPEDVGGKPGTWYQLDLHREAGTSPQDGTIMVLTTPTLETDRLRLRPFGDADAGVLFALHSDPHVLRYWDSPPWADPARATAFIEKCRRMADDGTGVRLAVESRDDRAFLGWCSFSRWNPDFRSGALGYCFNRSSWGHGYATEAVGAVLGWAFDTLDLNRVQAETDTRNSASARVLEKLGFQREGTLREDCVVNGDVSDSWVYGLLRRERPFSTGRR